MATVHLTIGILVGTVILVTVPRASIGQSGAEDPCLSPENMGNPSRNIHHELHELDDPISDTGLIEGLWYWFDQHGDNKIPEICPGVMHCGTLSPIWMNDSHPTDFGVKEVNVCSAEDEGNCCDWSTTILVKKCPAQNGRPEHYVYQLANPPYDDMAYCAGQRVTCDRGFVYNPTEEACVEHHPPMTGFPVLKGPLIRDGPANNKFFIFQCVIGYEPVFTDNGARFRVTFTFNGRISPSVPLQVIDGRQPVATLSEHQLRGNLGKTIKCVVESYWQFSHADRSTPLVAQEGYFAGIQIYPHSPNTLHEVENINVSLLIFSDSSTQSPYVRRPQFSLRVKRSTTHHRGSDCQVRFKTNSWTGANNRENATLLFKAIPDIPTKVSPFLSSTKFHPLRPRYLRVWEGYQVEDIIVNIKDEVKSAKCSAITDPHITTFDGVYYHNFARGDFLLWRSTAPGMHQEIHVRQQKWNLYPTASAICAVAVREHNTILGIDRCRGDPAKFITFLSETDTKRGTLRRIRNTEYEIKMASGLSVKVTYWREQYISVHAVVLGNHFGHTEGLCGSYNDDRGDDLHMRGLGMQHPQENVRYPNKFIETYRISPQESYFRSKADCVEATEPTFVCECQNLEEKHNKRHIECGLVVTGNKEVRTLLVKGQQKCGTLQRHKRSADDDDEELDEDSDDTVSLDDLFDPADTSETPPPMDMNKPTINNITMETARERCSQTLAGLPAYSLCQDIVNMDDIVNSCATDVLIGDSYEFADNVKADLMTSCVIDIEKDMVLVALNESTSEELTNGTSAHNNTELDDVTTSPGDTEIQKKDNDMAAMMAGMAMLRQIRMVSCPLDCSGHGACIEGACNCTEEYIGEACSQRADDKPQIMSNDVLCDKQAKACKHFRLQVEKTTDNFKCRFLPKHHTATGKILERVDLLEEVEGDFVTIGEVICRPPALRDVREDTTAVEYDLSISNNGRNYSEPVSITIYNSQCVSSVEAAGSKTYRLNQGYCLIGGRCRPIDVVNKNDSRLVCDPSNHMYDWTVRETTAEDVSTIAVEEIIREAWTTAQHITTLPADKGKEEFETTVETKEIPHSTVDNGNGEHATSERTRDLPRWTRDDDRGAMEKPMTSASLDTVEYSTNRVQAKQTTGILTTSFPMAVSKERGDDTSATYQNDQQNTGRPLVPILTTVIVFQVIFIAVVIVIIWYFRKKKNRSGQENSSLDGKINEGYETPLAHF